MTISTLMGTGKRFALYDDEPHGYRIVRLSDRAVATFYGDDQCERFWDHFSGDDRPDNIDDNNEPTDDVGEWAERENEFSTPEADHGTEQAAV